MHKGAAIEGATSEDVVDGKKQREEEELGEGLPVLIPNPRDNVYDTKTSNWFQRAKVDLK